MIEEENEIAEVFNEFFVSKIEKLKNNIDKDYCRDPLEKYRYEKKKSYQVFTCVTKCVNFLS